MGISGGFSFELNKSNASPMANLCFISWNHKSFYSFGANSKCASESKYIPTKKENIYN